MTTSAPTVGQAPPWAAQLLAYMAERADLPYVLATDHGVVGDDSTDNTTALQNLIDADPGPIFFPRGVYITGPITLHPGTILAGAGGQGYYNATTTVPNAAVLTRLKLKAGSTGALISPNDGGANLATCCTVRDICLDGNGIAQPAVNLPDQGGSISRFWKFDRVYIVNWGGTPSSGNYTVYIGNLNTGCLMRDCILFNGTSGSGAGGDAVGWYGQDGIMDNCWIGYWAGTGLTILGGGSATMFNMRGGGIFTCTVGLVVGGRGAVIDSVSIDHNFNDGIYAGYGPTTITNCWFHTNSRQTTNTWSNIRLAGTGQVYTITNCQAVPRGGETSNDPAYFISDGGTGTILNAKGNIVAPGVSFGTAVTNYVGTVTAPGFPSSTTAVTNTTGADVTVFVTNGTSAITQVTVGTTATGMNIPANGWTAIRLPAGQKIAFTYAGGTPSWTWVVG